MTDRLVPYWTKTAAQAFGATGAKGRQGELVVRDVLCAHFSVIDPEADRHLQVAGVDLIANGVTLDVKANLHGGWFYIEQDPHGWLFNSRKTSDLIVHVDAASNSVVWYTRSDAKNAIKSSVGAMPRIGPPYKPFIKTGWDSLITYLSKTSQEQPLKTKSFIVVRTQFEGFHRYPGAGSIDPRIAFLEDRHRHMFHVTAKMAVDHQNREQEFFLVKWKLQEFIRSGEMNNKSCEMMAQEIIEHHLIPTYGHRYYEVTVSEDGESDGIVVYDVENQQ
jgi:hypothetical protein